MRNIIDINKKNDKARLTKKINLQKGRESVSIESNFKRAKKESVKKKKCQTTEKNGEGKHISINIKEKNKKIIKIRLQMWSTKCNPQEYLVHH